MSSLSQKSTHSKPWGLEWRSSVWFVTLGNGSNIFLSRFIAYQILCSGWLWWGNIVTLQDALSHSGCRATGIATDMLVYSVVIPVFPFQLERLGYSHVSSLVGWLLFAYVSAF
jgi:DHA1 family solute carrier family 18 vesicular amine transporter 1/2